MDEESSMVTRLDRFAALALILSLGAGSLVVAAPPMISSLPPGKRGIVFVVGGVGGIDIIGPASQWALPRAGVQHEVYDFIWTHGKGKIFKDLQDTRHCLTKADELAARVMLVR